MGRDDGNERHDQVLVGAQKEQPVRPGEVSAADLEEVFGPAPGHEHVPEGRAGHAADPGEREGFEQGDYVRWYGGRQRNLPGWRWGKVVKKGPQQSDVKWEDKNVQTVNNSHVEKHPLDIPAFLKIPQAERDASWANVPLVGQGFAEIKHTRNEDEATRLFREQVEAEKKAKQNRRLEALAKKKRAPTVDAETHRWDPKTSQFVEDPELVKKKQRRLEASGLVTSKSPPASTRTGPKPPRVAKGSPIVRECAAEIKPPLPDKGKRREVAIACFQHPADIKTLAQRLGCSEGSVRSHLTDLHQKHGFGYTISDGRAQLTAPKGWKP